MAASPEVPPLVRQLATELAQPHPMRRGSVSERLIKCGKAGCACGRDPKARHGPYQSLTQAVGGKTRSRFLTPEQTAVAQRSEEHTSELQSLRHLVCRLLLEKKKKPKP